MVSETVRKYRAKYLKRYVIDVSRLKNPEIIDHMEKQNDVQAYIRNLIKSDMQKGTEMSEKKAMLSQPMAGKTREEIVETRERAIRALQARGYEIVNTLFTDEWYSQQSMKQRGVVQIPLCFLAKSLENMSLCRAAYFCKGWEKARGCRLEHEAAKAYGLEIIYEDQKETENHD